MDVPGAMRHVLLARDLLSLDEDRGGKFEEVGDLLFCVTKSDGWPLWSVQQDFERTIFFLASGELCADNRLVRV
jgi:hypothetical protein